MFATAFDFASVDFLAELDVPAFKIASGDLRNVPLLRYAAEVGRPLVFSTGGGTLEDVRMAYEAVSEINPQVGILQCTAGYPAEWSELDLRVIETYRQLFPNAVVGYSGHDNGIAMPVAAFVLGARIVEKHFTLNRALKGTDHRFSLEPQGLQKLCRDLRRVRVALGDGTKTMYVSESDAIVKMSKKIVAAHDLPAGHVLTADDVAFKSPGDGLPPRELGRFVGRTLRQPLLADGTLTLEHLEELIPSPGAPIPSPAPEGDGA
jgi:N-acetylneuraminate synthase/sialic acid synthase